MHSNKDPMQPKKEKKQEDKLNSEIRERYSPREPSYIITVIPRWGWRVRVAVCMPKAAPSKEWHQRLHTVEETDLSELVQRSHSTNKPINRKKLQRQEGEKSVSRVTTLPNVSSFQPQKIQKMQRNRAVWSIYMKNSRQWVTAFERTQVLDSGDRDLKTATINMLKKKKN